MVKSLPPLMGGHPARSKISVYYKKSLHTVSDSYIEYTYNVDSLRDTCEKKHKILPLITRFYYFRSIKLKNI